MAKIILPDDVRDIVEKAKSEARKMLRLKHKIYDIKTEGGVTTLDLFGGIKKVVINENTKLVTCSPLYAPSPEIKPAPVPVPCAPMSDLSTAIRWTNLEVYTPEFPYSFQKHTLELFVKNEVMTCKSMLSGILSQFMIPLCLKELSDGRARCVISKRDDMTGEMVQKLASGTEILRKIVNQVVNTTYGINWNVITKVVGKTLWNLLDPKILKYTIQMSGYHATTFDYNLVWNSLEEIEKVSQHSPSILPILPRAIGDEISSKTGVLGFKRNNIVKDIQNLFDGIGGISPAGWRYLLALPQWWVQRLITKFWKWRIDDANDFGLGTVSTFCGFIDMLAEIGIVPKFSVLKYVVSISGSNVKTDDLVAFLRAAFKESHKRKRVRQLVDEVSLTWDWFINNYVRNRETRTTSKLDHNQQKAPWSWFMRKQEQWHTEQLAKKKTEDETHWESLVTEYSFNGYQVVPLTNALMLWEEGQRMSHCVSSYSKGCRNGESRIFSIRHNGDRSGTVEIVKQTNEHGKRFWVFKQARARFNKDVSAAVRSVAKSIATRYNKQESIKEKAKEQYVTV